MVAGSLNSRSLVPRNLLVKHISSESNVLVQDFGKWFESQLDNVVPVKKDTEVKTPFCLEAL